MKAASDERMKTELEKLGYRIEKGRFSDEPWYAWKGTQGTPECNANDRPPCITVNPHIFNASNIFFHEYTVELCAQTPIGEWVKLMFYGLKEDKVLGKLRTIEGSLSAAWCLIYIETKDNK